MNNNDLERELDMLMAKAGASVPPNLKSSILAGYPEMKRMASVVRQQPRTAADEPSNVFSLTPYVKGA